MSKRKSNRVSAWDILDQNMFEKQALTTFFSYPLAWCYCAEKESYVAAINLEDLEGFQGIVFSLLPQELREKILSVKLSTSYRFLFSENNKEHCLNLVFHNIDVINKGEQHVCDKGVSAAEALDSHIANTLNILEEELGSTGLDSWCYDGSDGSYSATIILKEEIFQAICQKAMPVSINKAFFVLGDSAKHKLVVPENSSSGLWVEFSVAEKTAQNIVNLLLSERGSASLERGKEKKGSVAVRSYLRKIAATSRHRPTLRREARSFSEQQPLVQEGSDNSLSSTQDPYDSPPSLSPVVSSPRTSGMGDPDAGKNREVLLSIKEKLPPGELFITNASISFVPERRGVRETARMVLLNLFSKSGFTNEK